MGQVDRSAGERKRVRATVALELPDASTCGLGREPFRFRHGLSDHPAFAIDALADLCDAIPQPWISHHLAEREIVTPSATLRDGDGSIGDVVRGLEHSNSWLVVHHLEHVSPYSRLLDACVEQAAPSVERGDGRVRDRGATTFIGCPGTIVPVHIDRHHNFLLQLRGTKALSFGWFEDPAIQARETERNFDSPAQGSHLLPSRRRSFRLGPGDGVYIPAYVFHWVEGGSEPSVAFSCAFRTELTERVELAHVFNAGLRRARVPYRTAAGSQGDRAKASAVLLARRLKRRMAAR
jgi:hypothetical protein